MDGKKLTVNQIRNSVTSVKGNSRWLVLLLAYKGLSRMRGNSHVRFLGEGQPVMVVPYPTILLLNEFEKVPYGAFFVACHWLFEH